jgi:integron cassette Hfx-like protein
LNISCGAASREPFAISRSGSEGYLELVTTVAIQEIGLDQEGRLYVRPSMNPADDFEHIYRTASGIRWDGQLRTLHAYEPHRWDSLKLYKEICRAVEGEYGVRLIVTNATIWQNVPDTLEVSIRAMKAAGGQ